ncbi:hypothetical protein HGRIS_001733 [Hohenbuehelia grisea]|uniref:Uncharacterized protein n=1 Tax=Hohenbuehelia grisea TaxID=104357 RepID=A0ABR3JJK8_9AGAR
MHWCKSTAPPLLTSPDNFLPFSWMASATYSSLVTRATGAGRKQSRKLSVTAIASIAVGAFAIICIALSVLVYVRTRRKRRTGNFNGPTKLVKSKPSLEFLQHPPPPLRPSRSHSPVPSAPYPHMTQAPRSIPPSAPYYTSNPPPSFVIQTRQDRGFGPYHVRARSRSQTGFSADSGSRHQATTPSVRYPDQTTVLKPPTIHKHIRGESEVSGISDILAYLPLVFPPSPPTSHAPLSPLQASYSPSPDSSYSPSIAPSSRLYADSEIFVAPPDAPPIPATQSRRSFLPSLRSLDPDSCQPSSKPSAPSLTPTSSKSSQDDDTASIASDAAFKIGKILKARAKRSTKHMGDGVLERSFSNVSRIERDNSIKSAYSSYSTRPRVKTKRVPLPQLSIDPPATLETLVEMPTPPQSAAFSMLSTMTATPTTPVPPSPRWSLLTPALCDDTKTFESGLSSPRWSSSTAVHAPSVARGEDTKSFLEM